MGRLRLSAREVDDLHALHSDPEDLAVELKREHLARCEHDAVVRAEEVLRHVVRREGFRDLVSALGEPDLEINRFEVRRRGGHRLDRDSIPREGESDPLPLRGRGTNGTWGDLPRVVMSEDEG